MYRRVFLKITGIAISGLVTPFTSVSQAVETTQPNLLIFIADDLGWNDVGYHGSEIQTPNVDSIVADGVELNRNYAYPVCSPTRAAFFTGRQSYNNSIHSVVQTFNPGLPLTEHLMPQTFKSAGYQTSLVGKWHLGGEICDKYMPHNRGFDNFYGYIKGSMDPYTHKPPGKNKESDLLRNGVPVEEEGYCTDLFAAEAITLIENRDIAKPFFLCLSFQAVHTPLVAPQELIDKYEALGITGNRAIFAAKTEAMDTAIGTVLNTLQTQGIVNDTLVLFTSDNGGDNTDSAADNTPLRGRKGTTFEGGIRVPAAIKWPGVLSAGSKCTQVISVADYFPTLTTALGVTPGNTLPFDGTNRWDQIQGTAANLPPDDLIISSSNVAIFSGNWKLVYVNRTQNYLLFDIETDPYETSNVLSANSTIAEELITKIAPYIDLPVVSQYDPDSSGITDTGDVQILAENWLEEGQQLPGDIAPGCPDSKVDMLDLTELAKNWLKEYSAGI